MISSLSHVNAWTVAVPFLEEWMSSPEFGSHSSGKVRTLLEVCSHDGFSGWAENSGNQIAAIAETIPRLAQLNRDNQCWTHLNFWHPEELYWSRPAAPSQFSPDPADIRHRLRHPLQGLWEYALTDLRARRMGVGVSEFFGGRWRDEVPTDYWAGRVSPERAAQCALRAQQLGLKGIKLKTTLEDPNIERLEAIREAVTADFHVTVDPNGRFYRFDDAWPVIREMDRIGNLRVLEDPFPRFHLADFALLRPKIDARLAVHLDPEESFSSVLASGAAGALNIDSHRIGPFQWRILAGAAEQANLLIWHGGGGDLGIGTAWHLQLAACAPNCRLPGDQSGPWLRKDTLINERFTVKAGAVVVPNGPGIGVTINQDALDCYCQQKKTWKL